MFLFLSNKGTITDLLVNRLFVYIGNISAYAFVIHYVITQYTLSAVHFLHLNITDFGNIILISMEFVLSILLSQGYKYMNDKYISSREFK